MSAHRFTNWARTASCRPAEIARPASEDEVVALVQRAAGSRVRMAGAGHSWNDIACTSEVMMSLDRLDRVLAVGAQDVIVEGGTRMRALNERLALEGRALRVMGSIAEQTVAGAIATGTHGSAPRSGNLSSLVTGMRLVTAGGRVLDLGPGHALLPAARVSLGALGVVTQVTLRTEPAFRLEELTLPMRFDDALAAIPALVADETYVKLWWLPHTDAVQIFRYRPTTAASNHRPLARWVDEAIVNRRVFSLLLALGRLFPGMIPLLNSIVRAAYFKHGSGKIARSDLALTIAMPPLHEECEYALPVERAAEMLRWMRELMEREKLRVNFVVEARFVAGDDAWLSPAHGRDSVCIGAYMAKSAGIERYFAAFEEKALSMGGRPHWGKQFAATGDALRRAYPMFERFDAARRELDPAGMFVNPFLTRVFGAARALPAPREALGA